VCQITNADKCNIEKILLCIASDGKTDKDIILLEWNANQLIWFLVVVVNGCFGLLVNVSNGKFTEERTKQPWISKLQEKI